MVNILYLSVTSHQQPSTTTQRTEVTVITSSTSTVTPGFTTQRREVNLITSSTSGCPTQLSEELSGRMETVGRTFLKNQNAQI
jgi:hypothetical protein